MPHTYSSSVDIHSTPCNPTIDFRLCMFGLTALDIILFRYIYCLATKLMACYRIFGYTYMGHGFLTKCPVQVHISPSPVHTGCCSWLHLIHTPPVSPHRCSLSSTVVVCTILLHIRNLHHILECTWIHWQRNQLVLGSLLVLAEKITPKYNILSNQFALKFSSY